MDVQDEIDGATAAVSAFHRDGLFAGGNPRDALLAEFKERFSKIVPSDGGTAAVHAELDKFLAAAKPSAPLFSS